MPKVSIIIPVYNTSSYLHKCFASVYAQTLSDWEVIAVDDGSTDDSLRILNEYAAKDSRIRVISQQNAGPGGARNTGLDNAVGTYVTFLDSDDSVLPETYQSLLDMAVADNCDIVQFELRSVDDNGNILSHSGYVTPPEVDCSKIYGGAEVIVHNWFFTTDQTFFCHRDFLNAHKLRFIPGIYHEDTELIPKMIYYAERIRFCKTAFYHRHLRPGSVITTKNIVKCHNLITVGDSLSKFAADIPDKNVAAALQKYAGMCYAASIQYAAKSDIPIREIFAQQGSRRSYCRKLASSPSLKHRLMAAFIRAHLDRMFCAVYRIFADK